jgi:hypothetical protein
MRRRSQASPPGTAESPTRTAARHEADTPNESRRKRQARVDEPESGTSAPSRSADASTAGADTTDRTGAETPRQSRSPQETAGGAAESSDDDDEAFNPDDFADPPPYEAPEPASTSSPDAGANATTVGRRLFAYAVSSCAAIWHKTTPRAEVREGAV